MSTDDHAAALSKLLEEQYARFPPLTLPPEFAELIEVNSVMLLIKLARYKFAAAQLRQNDTVLEVGSGNGVGTMFLGQKAKSVTGVEINENDYRAAMKINRRKNVDFLNKSIFDKSIVGPYDAVISLDVIEHLSETDGDLFVRRLAKLCVDTGFVVIGTPSIYSFPHQGKYSQAAHIKCYDRDELRQLLDRHFERTFMFSMNDEIVHTGHPKMAWYYFAYGFMPRQPA